MNRTDLVNELVARGYKAEATEKVKNGVLFEGIMISDDAPVTPIIYTEKMIEWAEKEGKSIADVVEEIIRVYESSRAAFKFNIQQFFEKEWLLEHLTIGLQKTSEQELVKKEVESMPGIEAYLYAAIEDENGKFSVKLKDGIAECIQLDVEEAWKAAYEHVCAETCINSIEHLIYEMIGEMFDEPLTVEDGPHVPMYVISNKERSNGAACILNKQALKEFAVKRGVSKVYVLPSSIHEMILVPDDGDMSLDELSQMVDEVNVTQVDPEEQLPGKAYVFEF